MAYNIVLLSNIKKQNCCLYAKKTQEKSFKDQKILYLYIRMK